MAAETQKPLALTETPEFQEALAKVREEANRAVAEALGAARATVGTANAAGDANWAETFAMAIAQLTDQGTGRTHVAPEVLRARQDGRKRLVELIIAARAEGKVASYRLTNKVLLEDQLIDPVWIDRNHVAQSTEIDWPGVPNEAMVPINETAQGIYAAFMDSIGSVSKLQEDALAGALSVTPGGLVVKGNINKRSVKQTADDNLAKGESGLRLHHKGEPGRYKDVHILGSIAQPARQTV